MMGLSRTWGVLGCQCMPRPVLRGPESRWRHWPATAGAEGMRGRPEPGRRNPFTSSAQSNCLIPDSRQVTGRFSGLSVGGELPCLGTSACSLLTLTPPGKVLLKGRCERKKSKQKRKSHLFPAYHSRTQRQLQLPMLPGNLWRDGKPLSNQ